MRILPIIGGALAGAMLIFVGAGAGIWYVKDQAADVAPASDESVVADTPAEPARRGAARIEPDMLRELLTLVDAPRREAIIGSADVFARFVEQERANQAVLTAAYANAADRNDAVGTLMLRASQKVLAEAYLAQVVRRNLDPNFPSEAQAREYFDGNSGAYRLPDRVHVWQVFIPAPADASAQAINNAKALAAQVSDALASGKTTFGEAAHRYSKHLQSQVNDGYMGLLKTADLLPEVRKAIDSLKIGQVSKPVQSAAGFHILKRGERVAGQQLDFDTVRDQVMAQLRRDAATRVRQAALKKILETYPVAVDEAALPAWRKELEASDWAAGTDVVSAEKTQ